MIDLGVKDGVATITLEEGPVNAISTRWIEQFDRRLDELLRHDGVVAVHIRSDGKVFCAGADLDEVSSRFADVQGADSMYDFVRRIQALFARVERLPFVTLAELGGAAVGGGLELALCCDLRIAAQSAKIGLPEVGIGLLPGAGGTQRLTRLCGPGVAARLILGAELVSGEEAARLGIVHQAVPLARLPAEVKATLDRVRGLSPAAVAEAKACIAAAIQMGDAGFALELTATSRLFDQPDTRARIAAFLDRKTRPSPVASINHQRA